MRRSSPLMLAAALLGAAAPALAVTDPAGDLLPSFTGTPNPALDILAAQVVFDAGTQRFELSATTAGPIAGVPGLAFAFGFDRGGAANTPFAAIGQPDVRFNSVVSLRADGTGSLGGTPVSTWIDGATIHASVEASRLPGDGRGPSEFTWALWSQDLAVAGLARNADFGPGANVQVSSVPEPGSWALLAAGLGWLARRRVAAGRSASASASAD